VCECALETLEALVDHNLIVRTAGLEPRFAMLETVREFALQRLDESSERESARQRHANYVVAEIERAAGQGGSEASAIVASDELRLALQWLVAAELEKARRALTEAMELARRAEQQQLEAWLTAVVADVTAALGGPVDTFLPACEQAAIRLQQAGDASRLADVLVTLGKLRYWSGLQAEATQTLQQAIKLARQATNRAAELLALEWLAVSYIDLRVPTDLAIAEQERLLRVAQGAPRAEAGILMPLAWLYGFAGRFDEARRTLARSIAMFNGFGARIEVGAGAMNAGWIELLAGDPVAAEHALRQGRDQLAAVNERGYLATLTANLAEALHQQGRYAEAAREARVAHEMSLPTVEQAWALAIHAKAEARRGDVEAARRLLAEADARLAEDARIVPNLIQGELLLARGEVEQLAADCSAAAAAYRKAHALYTGKRAWPLVSRTKRLLDQVQPAPRLAR
jgi:tetratricopeptide (TPR) repeat protein